MMRAVLLASRQVEVRLMLPMVTVCDEVVWARSIFEQVRAELDAPPIPLGMMVEVPAAAIRAADFRRAGRLRQHRHQRPQPVHPGCRPHQRHRSDPRQHSGCPRPGAGDL